MQIVVDMYILLVINGLAKGECAALDSQLSGAVECPT
jgi:hypothetical protein